MCVCVCTSVSHTSFLRDPECVSEVLSVSATSSFMVSCMLSFFSRHTVWQRLCPQLTDWMGNYAGARLRFPLLSTLLSVLHSCSPPMQFAPPPPFPLFTTLWLPSPLHCALSSLGQWSTNTTCSAPSRSKKPLSTLGITKNVTDTNGNELFLLFCSRAWHVGVSGCSVNHTSRNKTYTHTEWSKTVYYA